MIFKKYYFDIKKMGYNSIIDWFFIFFKKILKNYWQFFKKCYIKRVVKNKERINMKKLQVIILLIITFIIGNKWHAMVDYVSKDIKHAVNVQYCNDLFQGNITACPYYNNIINNK